MSQENNIERGTNARMMSQWSACWAEKRLVLEKAAFQDLLDRMTNNPSQEQYPTEPHAELNNQQQNVLQSGPEFSQTGPHNQTQENNSGIDGYTPQHISNLRAEFDLTEEEQDDKELLDIVRAVVNKLSEDTNIHPLSQDVPAQEWHEMFDWTGSDEDTPPTASPLSLVQHFTEPHGELAAAIYHQQQSVLQSGLMFSHAGPHNQTQQRKGDLRGSRRQSSFSLSRHRRLWKRWQLTLSLLSRHRRLWKRWQLTLSLLCRHKRLSMELIAARNSSCFL
ncbi:uncharacterized protein [Paralichthys olivaceus]